MNREQNNWSKICWRSFFFPGFGIGASMTDFISAGYLPVLALVFSSIAIPLCISGGPYLT